jgi:hypothetical protein
MGNGEEITSDPVVIDLFVILGLINAIKHTIGTYSESP